MQEQVLDAVELDERVWRFARDGREWGPVSWRELTEMIAAGELPATALVWREGMSDWMSFDVVAQLETPIAQYAPTAAPDGTLSYYTPSAHFAYAGFWLRAGAFAIDMLIVVGAIIVTVVLTERMVPQLASPRLEPLMALLGHGGVWLYFALQESSRWQATIGKRSFGVKVTDMRGERIGFGRATGRHFGKYLSNILLVGFIMAGLTRHKQALHDTISGCLVLRR